MKAIVLTRYGAPEQLEHREVSVPVPREREVLVEVHAASVNALDWRIVAADPFLVRLDAGLFRPRFRGPGADLAGRVVALGPGATRFRIGDEVYGDSFDSGLASFAEFACAHEGSLAPKPANLGFAEAACIPMAGVTSLQGLRDRAGVVAGQTVLVHGAGGGVGTFAIQIARQAGARVVAVCGPGSVALAAELGADEVLDYTRVDFARQGRCYDAVLAVNGNRSMGDYRRVLSPRGVYVMVGGANSQIFRSLILSPLLSRRGGRRMTHLNIDRGKKAGDLLHMKELAERGAIRPVVDSRFPLQRAAEAIAKVQRGHVRGKVVVQVRDD